MEQEGRFCKALREYNEKDIKRATEIMELLEIYKEMERTAKVYIAILEFHFDSINRSITQGGD